MKMTDEEERLVEQVRKLDRRSRDDVMRQADAMVLAQEALREDYGLAPLDARPSGGLLPGSVPARYAADGKPAA